MDKSQPYVIELGTVEESIEEWLIEPICQLVHNIDELLMTRLNPSAESALLDAKASLAAAVGFLDIFKLSAHP